MKLVLNLLKGLGLKGAGKLVPFGGVVYGLAIAALKLSGQDGAATALEQVGPIVGLETPFPLGVLTVFLTTGACRWTRRSGARASSWLTPSGRASRRLRSWRTCERTRLDSGHTIEGDAATKEQRPGSLTSPGELRRHGGRFRGPR